MLGVCELSGVQRLLSDTKHVYCVDKGECSVFFVILAILYLHAFCNIR